MNSVSNLWVEEEFLAKQLLTPITITQQKWADRDKTFHPKEKINTWNHSNLSFKIQYEGCDYHPFRAYILDTSLTKKSFTIMIEDQLNGDDKEVILHSEIILDLKDYALPGTAFKIITLTRNHYENVIGKATFK